MKAAEASFLMRKTPQYSSFPLHIPLEVAPTFLQDCPLDTAADEGVVGHLVPDQVEDEGHPPWVLEGDFADQSPLEAPSVRERSVFVQEVTVLLSWKGLTNNPCFSPWVLGL